MASSAELSLQRALPLLRVGGRAALPVVLFAVYLALGFVCLYGTEPGEALNRVANRFTAGTNVALLNLIGVEATLDGTYIHTSTFSVLIVDRCSGLIAIVLLWAACLSLPVAWGERVRACATFGLIVVVLNQVRLVTEMVFGSLYPASFAILEEVVMRVLYAFVSLGLFWRWAGRALKANAS